MKRTIEQQLADEMETNELCERYGLLWIWRQMQASWEEYQQGKERSYWVWESHRQRFIKEYKRVFNIKGEPRPTSMYASDPRFEEFNRLSELLAMAKNPNCWFGNNDVNETEQRAIIATLEANLEALMGYDEEIEIPDLETLLRKIHE